MSKIHILSEETINKISAGEVVERPANVVKELLENSIDAESTSIEIEIKNAGKTYIRINDNGLGMSKEDLSLAIERHATSKISKFTDLQSLTTLGFRGEALPSIAAVSNLTIQSKPSNSDIGWEIMLSGGKLLFSREWNGRKGTIVEVRNLFFNTPARAKFLKSDSTEKQKILTTIEEIALSRYDISFRVISEGKELIFAPATKDVFERIVDILGKTFTQTIIPLINVKHPLIKIEGFITKPQNSLPYRNFQYLFVNKRPVTTPKIIMHSIYNTYGEYLSNKKHPGFLIFIEINPSEIDVNIHPTKREIRFTNEREIHDLLSRVIKISLNRPFEIPISIELEDSNLKDNKQKLQQEIKESYFKEKQNIYEIPSKNTIIEKNSIPSINENQISKNQKQIKLIEEDNELDYQILGQVFETYLICRTPKDLLLIDQHAAVERIKYEQYIQQWQNKEISTQGLLIPVIIDLSPNRSYILEENLSILKELGWDIEPFGKNVYRIIGIPYVLEQISDIKNTILSILDAISEELNITYDQKIEKIIRAACRSSIMSGDKLNIEEMQSIVINLFKCKTPFVCPHGRPTILTISRNDIEKHFKRK